LAELSSSVSLPVPNLYVVQLYEITITVQRGARLGRGKTGWFAHRFPENLPDRRSFGQG